MRLYTHRILGLGQNLQHLVIGQEEEAREEETFLLQVGVQTFVDFVQ